MAERVVSVRVAAKVDGAVAGLRKVRASVDDLTKADMQKPTKAFGALADKAALAGVAVAAGIGVAVKRFADFDKAMSAVAANSGAAGDELEKLRQAAVKLGADSQFSATEAAEGINELAKAGVKSADVLGGGLKGALDLAAAGQIGVAEAAETAATAMTQFRLDGSKVPHVADLLTNAANKAQGGVGDMGMALKQAGLVASQTGLTIEETTAGLTAFASAGLIGSDAGTSFKTMLQRLSNPSEEAADLMGQLGISAYDSSGQFVGLASVAGQLKTSMQDLTPAQRDAAMATIFGSDAVRAAAVLYNEGAEGIQKWTKEVSEQGAAAKQAATLTDNLMGDIERLGGAFDSVLIQSGSSANSSLRTLVQGLTGVVDIVGKIPGPVLLAGGALTTFALLAPKGVIMWRNYVAQLDTLGLSLDKITAKAPRAGAALGIIGKAGAVAAVASVAVGIKEWAAAAAVADPATDRLAKGLQQLADGAKESFDFGTILSRGIGPFKNNMEDTSLALEDFAANARAALDPRWYETATGSAGQALAVFEERAKQLDAAFAQMIAGGNVDGAKEAFDRLAKAALDQGVPVEKLKAAFPQYAAAIDAAAAAATNATGPSSELATETDRLEQAATDAQEALDALQDAILGLGDPLARQRSAQRDYEDAIDSSAEALKGYRDELIKQRLESKKIDPEKASKKQVAAAAAWADAQIKAGKALDVTTEAGRKNQAALDAIQTATLERAAADYAAIEATKGTEAATKAATERIKEGRLAFIDAATAAGMTKDEAKRLADQLGLIPENIDILVKQTGAADAGAQIDKAARDRYSTIWVTTHELGLRAAVVANQGQRVRADIRDIRGYASGGYTGAGGKYEPAGIVHKGEIVFEKAVVDREGISALLALRAGNARIVPGYADGGLVGPPLTAYRSAPSQSINLDRILSAMQGRQGGGNTFNVTAGDPYRAAQAVARELEWRAVNG